MELEIILGVAFSLAVAGFGVGVGLRLLSLRRSLAWAGDGVNDDGLDVSPASLPVHRLSQPVGARRTTAIHGINRLGYLRHTDGGYTRGYEVRMPATLYAEEADLERLYHDWARALQSLKQPGCVLQLRHEVWPDNGRALRAHLNAQAAPDETYLAARMLHTLGLTGTEAAARAGQYQDSRLTLWLRVPARHANDPSQAWLIQFGSFFPALAQEVRRVGLLNFTRAVAAAWRRNYTDSLCVRAVADEEVACNAAGQVFATLEQMSPVELRPFSREEMWREVYRGHRLNHPVAPVLADVESADLRQPLCGEAVSSGGQFLLHGDVPLALVSLFRPPTPVISAGMMRVVTVNPQLNFRHTTVVEYLTLDQEQAKARLKGQFQDLSRATTAVARKSPAPQADDPEASAAVNDLVQLRADLAGGRESLIEARAYAVAYSPRAANRAELTDAVAQLDDNCRQLVAALGRLPGADAAREDAVALRALYPQAIAGELSSTRTGREFTETTGSLARLAPLESVWRGSRRPHTLVTTPSQHLIGFDLFDAAEVPAPLGLLLAGSRGGKSVLLSEIITNALATIPKLRVRVVDYGHSQEPLVAALGGRHLKFDPNERATINVWDYPGLELGALPSELQKWYVVQDALHLARVDTADTSNPYARFAEDILSLLVREIYANEVPRNGAGRPKHEPRHEHLLEMLATYRFDDVEADAVRTQLRLALETFRGDPFLDAETAPQFALESPLDVYELKSLENFSDRVRQSLAFRIVARVMQSEGHREPDGTKTKMLLAFDEMWEYVRHYPQLVGAIERYARTGGKEGVLTLLATQAFKDITGTPETPNPIGHALMSNVGVKFIGIQTGDYMDLSRKFKLSPATVDAIDSIKNQPGVYSEFVGVWGAGAHQQAQKFRLVLNSPLKLWTYTSNADERNARLRVAYLRPHWPPLQVYLWLAEHYPNGLVAAGLTQIDETLLGAGD